MVKTSKKAQKSKGPEITHKKKFCDKSKYYQTNGDIEWYLTPEFNYEGFNKKTKEWDYELNRDEMGLWTLKGKNTEQRSQFRHDLMSLSGKPQLK